MKRKPLSQLEWLAQLRARIPACIGCKVVTAVARSLARAARTKR